MEILNKIGSWADKLTQIGVSVIALGVVLEVLFSGAGIPFWPNISVVDNIMAILGSLNADKFKAGMAKRNIIISGIYRNHKNWSRVSMGKINDIQRYVNAMPEVLEEIS